MRFCLLHHTGWVGQSDHFDLMLQMEDGTSDNDYVLKTFASERDETPDGEGQGSVLLVRPDHKRLYLDYEGPISGSRGNIMRTDDGELKWLTKKFEKNKIELRFHLAGKQLTGYYEIKQDGTARCAFRKVFEIAK